MSIPVQTFSQFVSAQASAWGASIGQTPAFNEGDVLLAIFEGVASQDVFLQAQAQVVNQIARLTTSTGSDVDTFLAQFGFTRTPPTLATGTETFTAPNPAASQVLIYPAQSALLTPGGAISYSIVPDTSQTAWNDALGAYILAVGQTSIAATVQATIAGSAYNVQSGQLTVLTTPIPGISSVTNPAAINNGVDGESDAAVKARFVQWLNSLSKATQGAIISAIAAVQAGLMLNLLENVAPNGVSTPGQFVAVVDNGSGVPPTSLVNAVQAAINTVRGFTILGTAKAVTPIDPTISLAVRIAAGYNQSAVEGSVATAIAAASLAIGMTLFVSTVEQLALSVAGVVSVQPGTTINGVAADLVLTGFQAARITAGNVSVGSY